MLYYFAYGSNLHHLQMKKRCPNCRFIKKITLANYKLTFRSRYGAADIEKEIKRKARYLGSLHLTFKSYFPPIPQFPAVNFAPRATDLKKTIFDKNVDNILLYESRKVRSPLFFCPCGYRALKVRYLKRHKKTCMQIPKENWNFKNICGLVMKRQTERMRNFFDDKEFSSYSFKVIHLWCYQNTLPTLPTRTSKTTR